ncbi:protein of unknown function, might belong to Collagenase family protein [Shewanella benthica]|uniref:Lipoprotein n=1 Tax=Shewanella benthica TaxID=43661 RepID=A0A330M6K5_9GAMM|nr:hypothetical protein [Shewanella benthica]SQH76630.1 protein of unknown function, might belong to Collagenase family protein [Shewanella benthica]
MGSCDFAVPYTRQSGNAPEFIVANTLDTQYSLYWIDTDSGQPYLDNVYATLNLNEMYSADFWTVGDRMMVTDSDDAAFLCLKKKTVRRGKRLGISNGLMFSLK